MSVGRNEPCPCGSGKKYKHCHAVQASGLSPSQTAPKFEEAQALLQRADYAGAIQRYTQILALNTEHADARHYLGMALYFMGELQAGLPHLKASIQLRPMDAIFRNNLGAVLEEAGQLIESEQMLRRAVELRPDYRAARLSLAKVQIRQRRYAQARDNLQILTHANPNDLEARRGLAEACHLLGEFDAMQNEFREILKLQPQDARTRLRFAELLAKIGLDEDALQECEALMQHAPNYDDALLLLAFIEARRAHHQIAEGYLQRVLSRNPEHPAALMQLAHLRRLSKDIPAATAILTQTDPAILSPELRGKYWMEMGAVLENQERFSEAFACFQKAKESLLAGLAQSFDSPPYDFTTRQQEFDALRQVAQPQFFEGLPKLSTTANEPQPLFITGFPRSGTTLTEQMLSMHPAIHAGGELAALSLVEAQFGYCLGSVHQYPEALADLHKPQNGGAPQMLRNTYLNLARQAGAAVSGSRFFTDKSTLNETRLPLIRLLFPDSLVVHVIRHPLDVVLSIFQNEVTHSYAQNIESIARYYIQVMALAEDMAPLLGPSYQQLRYENLLQDPETELRRLLDQLKLPWDARCLEFQKSSRLARTISNAQVRQPIYKSSQLRWRRYREQLAPAIAILESQIQRLGYTLD